MKKDYYPDRWSWEKKEPKNLDINPSYLHEAIEHAKTHETNLIKDLMRDKMIERENDPNDDGTVLGPLKDRGPVTGVILRNGYIVAEWGEPNRVDVAYSATKSFIATAFGLALERGLIKSVKDPVRLYDDEGFEHPHNCDITWHQFLTQTSEWEGVLWDKHWRAGARLNMRNRVLREPGTFYAYNDTRVNKLALALLKTWRRPLPQVVRDHIMEPIEASNTWRWHGYRNSWIDMDGMRVQSVSGGGHWGGGMWINSWDLARYGYLYLRNGVWKEKQLISDKWIKMMITPSELNPLYGYLWWLNTDKKWYPSAPETMYAAYGTGNWVFVDRENDLVVVLRWVESDAIDEFWRKLMNIF